jgi:NTE family protein
MDSCKIAKDVALVLSSGGARGLAHIGAIEELEAQGYRITSIAGCSMGALIGGVYAAGKLKEFREWMKTVDRKKMLELTDFSLGLNHIVKGSRILEAIMEFVPDIPIENLPIPYCAVATDLKAGREVVFSKGSLFDAIRASISLPSFYEPVHRDGMILIDGGVTNPIPLNRVVRHEGDILIGVDVSGHDYEAQSQLQHEIEEKRKRSKSLSQQILNKLIPDNIEFNYYTMLSRVSSLMIRQNSILMAQLMKPDILIDIQMSRYGGFDYDKSEKLIAIGKQKTQQATNKYRARFMIKHT